MAQSTTAQSTSASGASSDRLRRNVLGVAAVTFFVVSAAAPLTAVAGGYPIAMLFGNGPGVPAAVLVVTLILLLFSVGYTTMARHVSNAGSFFAFTSQGLGGIAGGAAAYVAVLAYNTMQIGLLGLFGAVTGATLSGLFGIDLPWWVWSLIGTVIVGILGYRQIDLSAKVLAVLVIAEYIAVLILDATILGAGAALLRGLHGFRGHHDLQRRGEGPAADGAAGDLPVGSADRRLLHHLHLVHGAGHGRR
jgi:amino acid transporter